MPAVVPKIVGRFRSDSDGARKPVPADARSSSDCVGCQRRPIFGFVVLPDFAVVVPAQRELHLQLFRERRDDLREHGRHLAGIVRGLHVGRLAGRYRAVAVPGDVVRPEECRRRERLVLVPQFAADGQRQVAAGEQGKGARHLAVERSGDALRLARLVVDLDAVDEVQARLRGRAERIDRPRAHARFELVVQDVAVHVFVDGLVLGARHGHVVVPAGQGARRAQHEALSGARHFVAAVARFRHPVADAAERGRQAGGRQRRAVGVRQDAHEEVADAHRVRRQHVLRLRLRLHELSEQLVVRISWNVARPMKPILRESG